VVVSKRHDHHSLSKISYSISSFTPRDTTPHVQQQAFKAQAAADLAAAQEKGNKALAAAQEQGAALEAKVGWCYCENIRLERNR
jgi:hypothetical protein